MQADKSEQRRHPLCIQCALYLLSMVRKALALRLSTRLGQALDMDSVESAISSNAIVLTMIKDGECLTSTRKNSDRGINMHVVTEVQHIVIMYEHGCWITKTSRSASRRQTLTLPALVTGINGRPPYNAFVN